MPCIAAGWWRVLCFALACTVLFIWTPACAQPEAVPLPLSEETSVDLLLDVPQHGLPHHCIQAARRLGELREPRAVEPLITSLTGQDFGTDLARWHAWVGGH